MSSRSAALAGLSLYAPCRSRARLAHTTAWWAVRALGPRALPGQAHPLKTPLEGDTWQAMLECWRAELGIFDDLALYGRTQSERSGIIGLLIRAGKPLAFVKARMAGDPELLRERLATEAVTRSAPKSFWAPPVVAEIDCGGWRTLAFRPLPPGRHRPPHAPPLDSVTAEIEVALQSLPRPVDTPHHWRPCHGDFTPWNLRRLADGRLALMDWERAGWAPPGADLTLYRATARAVLRADTPAEHPYTEAREYWRDALAGAGASARDDRLVRDTLAALDLGD